MKKRVNLTIEIVRFDLKQVIENESLKVIKYNTYNNTAGSVSFKSFMSSSGHENYSPRSERNNAFHYDLLTLNAVFLWLLFAFFFQPSTALKAIDLRPVLYEYQANNNVQTILID